MWFLWEGVKFGGVSIINHRQMGVGLVVVNDSIVIGCSHSSAQGKASG